METTETQAVTFEFSVKNPRVELPSKNGGAAPLFRPWASVVMYMNPEDAQAFAEQILTELAGVGNDGDLRFTLTNALPGEDHTKTDGDIAVEAE